jgi:hypothetical protein
MPLPGHLRRRHKPRDPLAGQVLGVYKGPRRPLVPPKVTPYRLTLLRAVAAGEVKRGQASHAGAWRWHHAGTSITVTRWITEFIGCGWAEVGKHLELTEAGRAQITEVSDAAS